MVYTPDPTDPTQPTIYQPAGSMAYEFQALKGYIQTLLGNGSNFNYSGGFRNRLINGSFSINQKGGATTLTAGNVGQICDRWLAVTVGAGATYTIMGGPLAELSGFYELQLAPASGTTQMFLTQRIESINVAGLGIGAKVTVSGLYFCDNINCGIPQVQIYSPTAPDNYAASNLAAPAQTAGLVTPLVVNTWIAFKNTFTLTISAAYGLEFDLFWGSGVAAHHVYVAELQLEAGSLATPFEYRPIGLELFLCQRYYNVRNVYSTGTIHSSGEIIPVCNQPLPANLRTNSPATTRTDITLTNCSHSGAVVINGANNMFDAIATSAASGTYLASYTITLSAEL